MSQQMDLESEQFMTLLTDALRAGPGSPEWHQAVGVLRASGGAAGADEYQMLVRAREDLESGRDYRAVKAGPGFSRKVLQGIEEEGSAKPRGLPSANLIALVAGGVILAVVAVIAVVLFRNPPAPPDRGNVEQLQRIYFVQQAAQVGFDDEKQQDLPAEWRMVGEVPLRVGGRNGLGPAATQPTAGDKRDYKAGAVVLAESVGPDQPRMVDATFKVVRATDAVIPEVFVAEGPVDAAKANRELVWMLKGGAGQVVLADGTVPPLAEKLEAKTAGPLNVKVRFDRDTVIVEAGEKRLYDGPHRLSATAPRYVGVRFRRKVDDKGDGVFLQTVKVLKP
jgi:hypothetical protein